MLNTDPQKDLYVDAVVEGLKVFRAQTSGQTRTPANLRLVLGPAGPGYWIARHAARQAATALLTAAQEAGVTPEQLEKLRLVASEVAYD